MAVEFENRNLGGTTYQVAIYTGDIYRMDRSHNTRPYSSAEYKYFTTNSREASAGYSRTHQRLRQWRPSRPLVLLHLLNTDTRGQFRTLLTEQEQQNLNFSFPVVGNVVSRHSEGEFVSRNYSVSRALCRLFGNYGIDGYYIGATPQLHSEIVLCNQALRDIRLTLVSEQTLSAPRIERAPRRAEEPTTPPRVPAPLLGAQGYQTPPRVPAQGYQTPRRRRRRQTRKH
jgi:hypothetical protein